MTTSLDRFAGSGLVITSEDGEPTGLVMPGTGEIVSVTDLDGVARWRRLLTDIEYQELRPLKRFGDDAIYALLDADGVYTVHIDGYTVSGESRGAWEAQEAVDADALAGDLRVLWQRSHTLEPDASIGDVLAWANQRDEFVASFFRVTREVTADGKRRLKAMGAQYASVLESHTKPVAEADRRARKAPSIRVTKP